jgi:hypothetical protein
VHAPSEDKSEDSKDSFYEELEQVFNHFPNKKGKSFPLQAYGARRVLGG